ncbi:L,D-transpeptidase [Bradyrhizobium lablabi]|uniref:L,D-transpeptidase family protein n=1 Tax=Bradyrhizobium lablabi TaxID=722472 RepID=UPI001BA73FE4|nr:L,D-transpeptidase [Bradyrhizobium lablabi]MBR0692879.1 L,D-transpeptidase family protein [Bradyrhizobium lablabi]
MRANGRRVAIFDFTNGRVWPFAILTAAGTIGVSTPADATLYYWGGYDSGYYVPAVPMVQPRRQKAWRNPVKKDVAVKSETGTKPQGPLVITVSIEKQRVQVFDSNGLFAESPVSTGMKGHSTPMGVFSIIQKHKFHHSNIYSNAPMPYMQRITWSGVAMHAGVLPGYPASHGCIRMPMAFAVKMWNWTRMGARVIVTPGQMTPVSFSHPLLVAQKVPPQLVGEDLKVDAPLGVKGDKGVNKPETSLDPRSTVGPSSQPVSLHDNTRTADARGSISSATASVTMSDAPPTSVDAATAQSDQASKSDVSADAARPELPAAQSDTASTGDRAKTEAPKVESAKPSVIGPVAPKAPDAPAAGAPDSKKDSSRLPTLAKSEPKRTGQISVLISRKDSRLYVRQNFAPLFDVPVTIAQSDRPLGTHVFTAESDKNDANVLRWTVVTLPVIVRHAARIDQGDRPSGRRKVTGLEPVEAKLLPAPNSPTEALDRITIPADAMARVTEALGTGASIIVADQGINQGETGEGTDFIVSLH